LQARVKSVASSAVSYGAGNGQVVTTKLAQADFLANYSAGIYDGQIVINAEPFAIYSAENPNDYGIGEYDGITEIFIPQLGFRGAVFNLTATDLISS